MKTQALENRKQVYVTDFKTPVLVGLFIWLFLMIGSFGYMWVKGYDLSEEWQKSKDLVVLLTLGIAGIMIILPSLAWQTVEIKEWENKLVYKNLWDRLLSRSKEFKLNEIVAVESKRRPKMGTAIHIEFKDGTIQKINKTNLRKGWELEDYLKSKIREP